MSRIENASDSCRTIASGVPVENLRRVWRAGDGSSICMRSIEPSDLELERHFVERLSGESRYMRLMSGRMPSEAEMIRWTRIDRRREGALVVTIAAGARERLIGVARYAMIEGTSDMGECAIVIDDAWHRHGLGRRLLASLIELATRSGVKRLLGTTLSENIAMLGLARKLGFTVSRAPEMASIMNLSLDLTGQCLVRGELDRA